MLARLFRTAQFARARSRWPRPESIRLGVLVLATLLMPVSYRAGSDISHPHTIFQGLVDLITGEPHHHGPAEPVPDRTTVSPFAPVTAPLSPGVDGQQGRPGRVRG
jgi:hypothetical protein